MAASRVQLANATFGIEFAGNVISIVLIVLHNRTSSTLYSRGFTAIPIYPCRDDAIRYW